jgi:hypothetical protein
MRWGDLGIVASIPGVCIGASAIVPAVLSNRTVTGLHRDTQETLKVLGEAVKGIGAGQTALGQILDRMDRTAEARYRDLKDRLDGEPSP